MIYVYRTQSSESARTLTEALDGIRIRSRDWFQRHRMRPNSKLVCWGERQAPLDGVRILNGGELRNKMEDALKLRADGGHDGLFLRAFHLGSSYACIAGSVIGSMRTPGPIVEERVMDFT